MNSTTESIWENFHIRLKKFILRRVNDENATEDILQEVFLKIHTRMHTLQDSQHLEGWVYQISRNAIIDYYRRPNKSTEIDDSWPAPTTPEPDAANEIASSLREMVAILPTPYQEALLLTDYEGLSQQQLADLLGLSLSGAKSRVQRARQKIKDSLLTCCHFEFDRYGHIVDYWEHCCCCEAG